MKTKFTLLIAGLILFIAASAQNQKSNFAHIEKIELENGLTVFLNEDHSKPEVFGLVVTKAGGKDDPADATGLAHYMEHMLFKGTTELGTSNWEAEKEHQTKIFELYDKLGKTTDAEERKAIQQEINEESVAAAEFIIPNEMSNIVSNMGGVDLNAGTGPDYTFFHNVFPPSQMERWLDLYSHRFINPVFRTFQAELEVVYEERNLYKDDFFSNILENFQKNFYKVHPYGQQPLIGTMEHLKNPSLKRMKEFYENYYVANNMALVLCGDFNSEEVIPLIKNKFERLPSGQVPEAKKFEEMPFDGREQVDVKMSPIKLALLGFRTPAIGHEDELAIEVCTQLLSNYDQTGLIDQLVLNGEIMEAMVEPVNNIDYSATVLFVIPKIIGQKLEEAEKLVLAQLEKLKNGEFDDSLLESIKLSMYKENATTLESNEMRAMEICEAFATGVDAMQVFDKGKEINAITREEVMAIANKYYGENYLAFFSKMGFPKPDKISKPGYDPIPGNTNATSTYAQHLENLAETESVSFKQQTVETFPIHQGTFYQVENKKNDIFNLEVNFRKGTFENAMLEVVAEAMNKAGTKNYSASEFKKEMSKLGSSYEISASNNFFNISIEGLDSNYEKTLSLLNELLTQPTIDEQTLSVIADDVKTTRKTEGSSPDNVGLALFNYSRYGKNSPELTRASSKAVKKLEPAKVLEMFANATSCEADIHYTGTLKNAHQLFAKAIKADQTTTHGAEFASIPTVLPQKSKIQFVHDKKAVQCKIFIYAQLGNFDAKQQPVIDAFNSYFGNGFTGLVTQEIREFRSLAYSSDAIVLQPQQKSEHSIFVGYMGTQADKTIEAIEVFNKLIREMPQKPERITTLKNYLLRSSYALHPDFRGLSEEKLAWQRLGFDKNPVHQFEESYKDLTFDDVVKFWEGNIKDAPIIISIVGNKKLIDVNKLKAIAPISFVKKSEIFKK